MQNIINSLPEEWKNIDVLLIMRKCAYGLEPIFRHLIFQLGCDDGWKCEKGLLYVSQPIIKLMKANNSGHIVNISSVAARQTYANGTVYCANKKQLMSFLKMQFELLEFGIKVTQCTTRSCKTDFLKLDLKATKRTSLPVYAG